MPRSRQGKFHLAERPASLVAGIGCNRNTGMEELKMLLDDVLKKFNAKALSLWNSGGLVVHSQKPVRTLEDRQGLLVGAISPPTADLIKILGGAPVTIPFPDIYMSLQKKVIDASIFGCRRW